MNTLDEYQMRVMFLDSSLPFADWALENTAMLLSNAKPQCFNGPKALDISQSRTLYSSLLKLAQF